MSRRVYVIEWRDKNGVAYRTAPAAEPTDEWMKSGARKAFEAMCKPILRELEENDDGYLVEP
jgi:hypothetical protein